MTYSVSITLQQLYEAVQPFVAAVTGLDSSVVIQGLPNRAAMPPASPGYVSMTVTRTKRLRYNIDTWDTTNPAPTTLQLEQGTEIRMQLDCYGASAGDWATMLSTVLKDSAGVEALLPTCAPLYAEEPILAPLDDSEEQYEQRWIVGAILQYNPVTTISQQFMAEAEVVLVNVDEAYPPT
jgi:hypothetical protein